MLAGNIEGIEDSSSTKKRQLTDSSQAPTDESIEEDFDGIGDELNNDGKVLCKPIGEHICFHLCN